MIHKSQLRFQPLWDERHKFYELASEHSCGLEIVSFAMPSVITDENLTQKYLSIYQQELRSLNCKKSLHGAFIDIIPHSPDKEIKELARKRIYQSLDIAMELGCTEVIFHTGINTLIRNPGYLEFAATQQSEFWVDALNEFPELKINLENMWESDPNVFREIIQQANNERLRVCFDCGHANVFGKDAPHNWMKEMTSLIPYMHWNDNHGDVDSEFEIGAGNIDWLKMVKALDSFGHKPTIVLEVGPLEKVLKSIEFLSKNNLIYA